MLSEFFEKYGTKPTLETNIAPPDKDTYLVSIVMSLLAGGSVSQMKRMMLAGYKTFDRVVNI